MGIEPPTEQEEEAERLSKTQGVVFVLDGANLEIAKVGKGYQLLNCDDHANFLKRNNKDPAQYRPDICHQALLMILDSPLNKAGKIKALYVQTNKNTLLQINPQVRIPRTFKRFSGLMVQLLQKLSIRATNGPDKLMKVIKGPVTKYFPPGVKRVGFSFSAPNIVTLKDMVKELPDDQPVVFCVGAFAHGRIDSSWCDQMVSVSQFPLSAAYVLSRITNAFEEKWDIV